MINLGIVGCGAVATIHHLPAISASDQFKVTMFVDESLEHAKQQAGNYGISAVSADYRQLFNKVDAAVIALPNEAHAPVAVDLLKEGIHVLVEKPMALNASQCDQMLAAAQFSGSVLAVGMDFRFIDGFQFIKTILDQQMLGNLISFDIRVGSILNWPMQSNYLLQKKSAGGGVLIDFGPHILDLLLWWLGDYNEVQYYDDAVGGVESNCELHLRLKSGASGIVELSRVRKLSNRGLFRGEFGTLEADLWTANPQICLRLNNQRLSLSGSVMRDGVSDYSWGRVFRRQYEDFANAILQHREPFVSGNEGKRAVKLIETCYASRRLLKHPWVYPQDDFIGTEAGI